MSRNDNDMTHPGPLSGEFNRSAQVGEWAGGCYTNARCDNITHGLAPSSSTRRTSNNTIRWTTPWQLVTQPGNVALSFRTTLATDILSDESSVRDLIQRDADAIHATAKIQEPRQHNTARRQKPRQQSETPGEAVMFAALRQVLQVFTSESYLRLLVSPVVGVKLRCVSSKLRVRSTPTYLRDWLHARSMSCSPPCRMPRHPTYVEALRLKGFQRRIRASSKQPSHDQNVVATLDDVGGVPPLEFDSSVGSSTRKRQLCTVMMDEYSPEMMLFELRTAHSLETFVHNLGRINQRIDGNIVVAGDYALQKLQTELHGRQPDRGMQYINVFVTSRQAYNNVCIAATNDLCEDMGQVLLRKRVDSYRTRGRDVFETKMEVEDGSIRGRENSGYHRGTGPLCHLTGEQCENKTSRRLYSRDAGDEYVSQSCRRDHIIKAAGDLGGWRWKSEMHGWRTWDASQKDTGVLQWGGEKVRAAEIETALEESLPTNIGVAPDLYIERSTSVRISHPEGHILLPGSETRCTHVEYSGKVAVCVKVVLVRRAIQLTGEHRYRIARNPFSNPATRSHFVAHIPDYLSNHHNPLNAEDIIKTFPMIQTAVALTVDKYHRSFTMESVATRECAKTNCVGFTEHFGHGQSAVDILKKLDWYLRRGFTLGERACMPHAREHACFTHHRVSYEEQAVLARKEHVELYRHIDKPQWFI
jgi:hypothetical protein